MDGFPGIVGVDDDGGAVATELNVLNGLDDDGDGLVDKPGSISSMKTSCWRTNQWNPPGDPTGSSVRR